MNDIRENISAIRVQHAGCSCWEDSKFENDVAFRTERLTSLTKNRLFDRLTSTVQSSESLGLCLIGFSHLDLNHFEAHGFESDDDDDGDESPGISQPLLEWRFYRLREPPNVVCIRTFKPPKLPGGKDPKQTRPRSKRRPLFSAWLEAF